MNKKRFWQLVVLTAQLNLKSEASKSYLTYAWWFLEPLLFVASFYVVFGIFMAQNKPGFVVFLLCGQIPFLWFSRAVSNSCSSIEHGVGLMSQVHIPKLYFPLVTLIQDSVKSFFVFLLLFLFLILYGVKVTPAWLSLPAIMFVQLCFIASLALLFSMIVPFIPDVKYLVATGIQLVMFGSGIFYDFKTVIKDEHIDLFLSNPVASLINQYRTVLIDGQLPDWKPLFLICLLSLLAVAILVSILRKIDSVYPRVLME